SSICFPTRSPATRASTVSKSPSSWSKTAGSPRRSGRSEPLLIGPMRRTDSRSVPLHPLLARRRGDLQDLGQDVAVGGESFACADRRAAVPIGERAAGLFDDRLYGGGVPDVHDRIDHQLG